MVFGYVRPLKGELKICQFEQFKSVYCGLCRQLKVKYGWLSTFMLSYDLTFLAMLLSKDAPVYKNCRCAASPFRKKCVCCSDPALEKSAAVTVVLGWHKLRDSLADDGFFGRLKARISMLLFKRAYKKACADEPEFDRQAASLLGQLSEIEAEAPDSIDKPADCFGKLLECMVEGEENRRAAGQLLYNLGRWIYIVDAWDDFEQDVKKGNYNPIRCRFGTDSLDDEQRDTLQITLTHSENLMISAFQLLPANSYTPIIENILCLGLPVTVCQVRKGTWNTRSNRHPST